MTPRKSIVACALACACVLLGGCGESDHEGATTLTPKEQLGKSIFFDTNLSLNRNQACAGCHGPEAGWTGVSSDTNAHGAVYQGSVAGRFGNRKPPSSAYATLSPIFGTNSSGDFLGGNFWDGRATGAHLGNPAADQAQGPFLNPVEQALSDAACVVYRVCTAASYPVRFVSVWGTAPCNIAWSSGVDALCAGENIMVPLSAGDRATSNDTYDKIALSIAAFEGSAEVNAFTSKFDAALANKAVLSAPEANGLALFQGKAMCNNCHISTGHRPLFTDFTYDNLGAPKNPENPVYAANPNFVDQGLGGYLQGAGYPAAVYEAQLGKAKVPTLRNLDLRPSGDFVKAYGHNGYFKTLEGIVHFYNTRDVLAPCPGDYTEPQALEANCWPAPEEPMNVNRDELGALDLTADEESAIVAFLKTLSDGYTP